MPLGLIVVTIATAHLLAHSQEVALPWEICTDESESHTGVQQIAACSTIIASSDTTPENLSIALQNRGLSFVGESNYERAIVDFDRALSITPENAWLHYNRALASYHSGDFEGSIRFNTQAIQRDARFAKAYHNRGNAYLANDDRESALRDYNEAVLLDGALRDALINRGRLHLERDNYALALADFDAVVRLSPSDAVGHAFRGMVLAEKGELRDAVAAFERALRLDPETPGVQANLAMLRERQRSAPTAEMTVYRDCVLAAAVRLERSGEDADVVAASAVETCRGPSGLLQAEVTRRSGYRAATTLEAVFRDRLVSEAQARVVEIRSRRSRP